MLDVHIPLIFLYMDARKSSSVCKVPQRGKRHLIMLVFQDVCTDLKSLETTSSTSSKRVSNELMTKGTKGIKCAV